MTLEKSLGEGGERVNIRSRWALHDRLTPGGSGHTRRGQAAILSPGALTRP
jgi:hypothetical protein